MDAHPITSSRKGKARAPFSTMPRNVADVSVPAVPAVPLKTPTKKNKSNIPAQQASFFERDHEDIMQLSLFKKRFRFNRTDYGNSLNYTPAPKEVLSNLKRCEIFEKFQISRDTKILETVSVLSAH